MATHALFAYIHVKNAGEAIAFYSSVFGATEKFRLVESSGRINHVELAFGAATQMPSDEFPEYGLKGPAPAAPQSSRCTCM